jgi:hypothetical protein
LLISISSSAFQRTADGVSDGSPRPALDGLAVAFGRHGDHVKRRPNVNPRRIRMDG